MFKYSQRIYIYIHFTLYCFIFFSNASNAAVKYKSVAGVILPRINVYAA